MAFSLTHQKSRHLELGEYSREQFLVLAIEAAQQADWNIGAVSAHGFSAYTSFSLSSFSEEVSVEIQEDRALIKSECVGTQLFDWQKNYRNLQTFRRNLDEVKQHLTAEDLANRYQYFQQEHCFSETSELTATPRTAPPTFFSLFVPAGGYFITPILLNLNLLVFLVMAFAGVNMLNPDSVTLLNWGANFQFKTLDGQLWRLLSCTFLHAGIFHLVMNMFALVSVGSVLEPLLGRKRFLAAYLITGLLASLASAWWYPVLVCVGASGAIFGLYGLFLALLMSNYIEPAARKAFFISISIFVVLTLFNGLNSRGIDNAAHLGGVLSGFILGFVFLPALRNDQNKKLGHLTFWAPVSVAFAIIFTAYAFLPNNMKIFDEKLSQFKANEAKAKEVYDLESEVFKGPEINQITQNGVKYWSENLKIAGEIAQLDLSSPYYDQGNLLRNYSEIRLKNYELMQKISKAEDTEPFRRLYKRYNANIRWCMRELGTE